MSGLNWVGLIGVEFSGVLSILFLFFLFYFYYFIFKYKKFNSKILRA